MDALNLLLKLRLVTKSFGAVRALNGVSFDLRSGEVHALLGENGAGKSTLIKVITGAHAPDEGSLEVCGQPVHHWSPAAAHRLGIACIYQQPALFSDLTVAENIGLRLESNRAWQRIDWRKRQSKARELLGRLGAGIDPETEVRQLSMPEQQLVEIACALGAGARIVLMDEPTASLTGQEQSRVFEAVRELRQSGAGVVYISHRMEEIMTLADRVTVLRDGQSMGTFVPAPTPSSRRTPEGVGSSRNNAEEPGSAEAPETYAEMDQAGLIERMVGRALNLEYPTTRRTPGEPVVSLRRLGCSQSGVREVTLEIRAGEVVGLAGLVGAGRTELAKILFGLTPADSGEMQLGGRVIAIESPAAAIAHGIAYVPEDRRRHGIILPMPITHNVTMAVHRRLFRWTWLRPRAERQLTLECMRQLGVKANGPDVAGASLSGGNQQKISLARWLVTRPALLILDEPTQGVDVGAKSEIHRIICGLADQGMAVLMISSDLPEVLGMSDRIAVMRGGTLAAVLPRHATAQDVMAAALGTALGSAPSQISNLRSQMHS